MEDLKEYKPYEGKRPFVFVSYSHDDPIVLETVKLLQAHEYRIWYDNGIHTGDNWGATILKKVQTCTAFVVFLSPESVKSKHVQSEVTIAFRRNDIAFIPIWITAPCETGSMEYFLSSTQVAFQDDARDHTAEELFHELDRAIPDSLRDAATIKEGVLIDTQDDVHDLILDETITAIGDGACKARINLTKVFIPRSITSIGNEAFRGCSALPEIYVPREVEKIGDSCFRDCVSLKKLTIEENIEIGERAFENCGSLTEIHLPDDLTEIYNGVFNSCRKLKRIKLPASLIALGDSAFASCDALEEIVIPPNATRIDDQVFSGCTSLKNVMLSDSISRIGKNVFKDCVSLESINIPHSVRKIDTGCFRGCTSLKEIVIDRKNRYFKSMNGIMFNKNKSTLICYPTCIEGEVYEIPDSVQVIEDWAFADAKNVKKVIIPDSVERIGEGAFFHCENLEEIVIPYSVDTIQDTAFRGCENLKHVYIAATSFKDLGWGLFYGCKDVVVHCVSQEVEDYCERVKVKHQRYKPE